MAKTTNTVSVKKTSSTPNMASQPVQKENVAEGTSFSFYSFRTQAIIVAILALLFYGNTFKHEYAFDDMMAIVSNDYVQQGSAGIGRILTSDAYQSYLEHKNSSNQLEGGRYRPLSLVTFAIEQQFMGVSDYSSTDNNTTRPKEEEEKMVHDMQTRHVVNVLLYALAAVALLYFFRKVVFSGNEIAAFIAALIFTIHPIHTEVVANVKSRDEILSVLFIALTFILSFRYSETKKTRDLILSLVSFLLALLSKEYAVTLLVLLPLSFYLLRKETVAGSLKSLLPFLIPFALYMLMRLSSVTTAPEGADANIMNNPYLFATTTEKLATEIMVILNYLRLLVFPHPLVSDYSFNQIPCTNFGNPIVWASLIIHIGLVGLMLLLLGKRNVLSFAIAIYLGNLALVSNFFFNIGAPMGERLIFHSSVGFAIVVGYLLCKGAEKIKSAQISGNVLVGCMAVLIVLSGFKTFNRNLAWKNNNTLFLTDVKTSPNSVLVNTNAGSACMAYAKDNRGDSAKSNDWFRKAVTYFDKAISINPKHYQAYQNRGLSYFNMGMPDKALADWDTVRKYAPNFTNTAGYLKAAGRYFFGEGMKHTQEHDNNAAINSFEKAADATPEAAEVWYNLGVAYLNANRKPDAQQAFSRVLKISPNSAEARNMMAEATK